MAQILIEIPVGDTWPTREELAARNEIIDEINRKSIGTCTGAGGGMKAMDFSYSVTDVDKAREVVAKVLQARRPEWKSFVFRIDQLSE
jgi:hypothetical protein